MSSSRPSFSTYDSLRQSEKILTHISEISQLCQGVRNFLEISEVNSRKFIHGVVETDFRAINKRMS